MTYLRFAGVISTRSLGGGAGSGFGEEILSLLYTEAPKVPLLEVVLWPATHCDGVPGSHTATRLASQSASCLEPYNALLAVHEIIQRGGGAVLMDNAALGSLFKAALPSHQPHTQDLNYLVAQPLSSKLLDFLRFISRAPNKAPNEAPNEAPDTSTLFDVGPQWLLPY